MRTWILVSNNCIKDGHGNMHLLQQAPAAQEDVREGPLLIF